MWGGLPPPSFLVVCFVWASVVWAGLEGVSRTEAAAGWPCAVCVGLVGCGVVWCRKHACLWWVAAAVVVVVVCCGGCPWCVLVCVCGGGMLSGFWGSAPWLPGLWFCFAVVGWGCGCGWVGCELYSGREHLTVSLRQCLFCRVLLFVFLSVRWMPWHQGPMKDVVACDIPRGAGWRAVIRGFPNGGTRHELCRVTCI